MGYMISSEPLINAALAAESSTNPELAFKLPLQDDKSPPFAMILISRFVHYSTYRYLRVSDQSLEPRDAVFASTHSNGGIYNLQFFFTNPSSREL